MSKAKLFVGLSVIALGLGIGYVETHNRIVADTEIYNKTIRYDISGDVVYLKFHTVVKNKIYGTSVQLRGAKLFQVDGIKYVSTYDRYGNTVALPNAVICSVLAEFGESLEYEVVKGVDGCYRLV